MSSDLIDLAALPAPAVVETLSYEQLFRRKLQTLIELDPTFSALVEADPAIKLLEADSYVEMILRQRINDAARARLLAFAAGSDLDQLAAYYGVERIDGEEDASFKARVRENIMGRSAAGTAAQYRYAALSASIDVAEVAVDSPVGGVVRVTVLSRIGDGTPSDELLALVADTVANPSVRALCHSVLVVGAQIVPFDVTAQIWLTPTASINVFNGLEARLRDEFDQVASLGYNPTGSWISSKLQIGGVHRVSMTDPLPGGQIAIGKTQCAALRNVNLVLAGRDY